MRDQGSTTIETLHARLAPELVDWFAREIDEGDAPELHLVGLRQGDLERCFAAIVELAPQWNDRTFHIDDEGVDVTVHQRPDVAHLADQIKQFMETLQADPFGELPGYRGSMTVLDRDNARLVGIGFYASAGQADEADALLTAMPDTFADQVPDAIRPALDMRPESVGL